MTGSHRPSRRIEKDSIPSVPTNDDLDRIFAYCKEHGAIDLQHQNATPQDREIVEVILRIAAQDFDIVKWTEPVKIDNPPLLRQLALTHIFQGTKKGPFENLMIDNVIAAPDTSTTFLRAARTIAASEAREKNRNITPVVLVPEGNYRRNIYNDEVTGVKMVNVPVNPVTCKMTADSYEHAIQQCLAQGETPVLLQIESPSNPWMQIYSPEEQKQICAITEKYGMYLLHDCYLMDTEYPEKQEYFSSHSANPDKVITIHGMRRLGHVDSFGRAGFAITSSAQLASKLADYVKSQQIRFTEGNLITSEAVLSEVITPEKVRQNAESLYRLRQKAEEEIRQVPGLTVAVEAQAGPFIIMGFDEPLRKRMKQLGIDDGFRAMEYFAMRGVNLMPVEIMSTGIHRDAFRVNCTHQFEEGLSKIKETLDAIKQGVPYSRVQPEIAAAYAQGEKMIRGKH